MLNLTSNYSVYKPRCALGWQVHLALFRGVWQHTDEGRPVRAAPQHREREGVCAAVAGLHRVHGRRLLCAALPCCLHRSVSETYRTDMPPSCARRSSGYCGPQEYVQAK